MKQWDIWTCDFADAGPHPAIIVSHPDRVARAPLVNVLIGSSQKAGRPANFAQAAKGAYLASTRAAIFTVIWAQIRLGPRARGWGTP